MENRKLGIVGATITGLNETPHYLKHKESYVCNIWFSDFGYTFIQSILTPTFITETQEKAIEVWEEYKAQFKKLSIKENSRVLLLYDMKSGDVIGITHANADRWLDVRKNFTPRPFMHLIGHYDEFIVFR